MVPGPHPATSIHLNTVYGCFHATIVDLSIDNRDPIIYKAKHIYCLVPTEIVCQCEETWVFQGD